MTLAPDGRPHASRGHNPGLDFVRSAAILLVLYAHAASWFVSGQVETIRAGYLGALGVELFFALSGFLIGGILLRTCDAGLTPRTLARFWVRRWLRTLPAYYATITVLCCYYGEWDWPTFAFAQNLVPFPRWAPLTPHTWSLVLEEWFYLLFPLLLLPLMLCPARRVRAAAVPLLCATLIVLCTTGQALALRGVLRLSQDPNINPLLRLDAPAWGVVAAWAVRRHPLSRRMGLLLLLAGLGATAVQGWATMVAFDQARWNAAHFAAWASAWSVLRVSTTSLGLALVVAGSAALVRRPVLLLSPAVGWLAALSYALYLAHVPVLAFLEARVPALRDTWPGHLVVLAAVFATALLIRHGVERPALALRDRLVPDRPSRRAPLREVGHHSGVRP